MSTVRIAPSFGGAAVAACLLLARASACLAAEPAATGGIQGALTDTRLQYFRTGNAVVFLCDAESGAPISAKTRRPIKLSDNLIHDLEELFGFDGYLHAVTDDQGAFQLDDIPVGTYKLAAQSWAGISGAPRAVPGSREDDKIADPSSLIVLHGTAEVEVTAGERATALLEQWGDESMRIVTDPEEPHNFLFIGRDAPIGDWTLGPTGWGRQFIKGLVAITRMEDSHITIMGLPRDHDFHISLFNYDNSAGFGGGTFRVGQAEAPQMPIYALWSNGKRDQPPRLVELTEHLEKATLDVEALSGLGKPSPTSEYLAKLWDHADDPIHLEGFGDCRLIDLIAAESYKLLRKSRRK